MKDTQTDTQRQRQGDRETNITLRAWASAGVFSKYSRWRGAIFKARGLTKVLKTRIKLVKC